MVVRLKKISCSLLVLLVLAAGVNLPSTSKILLQRKLAVSGVNVLAITGNYVNYAEGYASVVEEVVAEDKVVPKDNAVAEDKVVEQAENLISEMQSMTNNVNVAFRRMTVNVLANRARTSGFVNYDLRTRSNLTGDQIDAVLVGTGLYGLGDAYAKAEADYGVSALFLVALSALESAWGRSYFAVNRNNLFGFQAFTNNPGAARFFESKEECIDFVARFLSVNYLSVGGRFHRGMTVRSVNHFYASDPKWYVKVAEIMERLSENLKRVGQ